MALQSFGPVLIPPLPGPQGTANILLDASGEKAGMIFPAPAAGNITGLSFLTGTVTTGDDLLVSLQTVDATTGDPDETADQSVVQTVLDTDDNTKFDVTLGAARTVTKGEMIACVFEFNSYVAGNLNIRGVTNPTGSGNPYFKNTYISLKTGGTWSKTSFAASAPLLAINYGGTYHHLPGVSVPVPASIAYGTGSTPDERALLFNSSVPLKVVGIAAVMVAAAPVDFILYDSDGTTPLGSCSIDPDMRSSAALGPICGFFASEVTLAASTNYRAAVKPTSASTATLHYIDAGSSALLAQMGGATGMCMSTQTDGAGWSQVADERPLISLIVSAVSDGGGGGSGTPGNLLGGIFQ